MINYFLPDFFFHKKLDNHTSLKKSLYPEILKIQKDVDKPWSISNCRSSFENENANQFLYSHSELVDTIWSSYDELLSDSFIKNSHDYRYPTDSSFQSMWFNVYDKGDYQEVHNHVGGDVKYSLIYILHDESDTGVCFNSSNPLITKYSHVSYINSKIKDIGEGSLLIFPAYFDHFVLPATGKRVSITANILST